MSRTPQEILTAHVTAVLQGDMPEILKDYSDDAVLLTPQGVLEGRAGIEEFYSKIFELFPGIQLNATSIVASGDALLVNYTVASTARSVSDGVDSFVFADDAIRIQTSSFTIQPRS